MAYGFNTARGRTQLWSSLVSLGATMTQRWIVLGDFNVVRSQDERKGGNPPLQNDINDFNDCIFRCALTDLTCRGGSYSWTNNQLGSDRTWSKLDRALVNSAWLTTYPYSFATLLPSGVSDHSPLLIKLSAVSDRRPSCFQFLNCWVQQEHFHPLVMESWKSDLIGTPMFALFANLKNVKRALKHINAQHFSHLAQRLEAAAQELSGIQDLLAVSPLDHQLLSDERRAKAVWLKLKEAKVSMLRQRAKTSKVSLDDSNTSYFFKKIAERKQTNSIGQIYDMNGQLCITEEKVAQAFVDYYSSLLGSAENVVPLEADFVGLGKCLTTEQAVALEEEVSVEEIRRALWDIDPNKSPGQDGFTSGFFKATWDVVGQDFIHAMQDFFRKGKMLKTTNVTVVTLVPKKQTATSVMDYRPISCCTTIYKTISKVLANRLQGVLPSIVGEEQAAFVKGRSIFDNILLSQALTRSYSRTHMSPRCLIKVDIRKAFDSLNWDFVLNTCEALGFPPLFVRWLKACITTASYTLKINGSVFGYFEGRRGIRQGDPLSPYIFVLSMEILSRYLRTLPRVRDFSYHPKCSRVQLTHLIFADDLMVFTRGDVPSVMAVVERLNSFASMSGLKANPDKTDIYIGGVQDQVKRAILTASGFSQGVFPFRYLGLPLATVNLTADMYKALLERVRKHVLNWANTSLTNAGRVQIINSIFFGMECFWCAAILLPKGVLKRLGKICKDFLWNIEEGKRKFNFLSWKDVCLPKREGGFGIKEVLSWNKALICRSLLSLELGKTSIWLTWLRRYKLKNSDLWTVLHSVADSEGWKAILTVRDELVQRAGSVDQARELLKAWNGKVTPAYDFFRHCKGKVSWSTVIWSSISLPKHAVIGSLAIQKSLPTIDNLCRRGMVLVNQCVLCKVAAESHKHLFFDCIFSMRMLQSLFCWMGFRRRVRSLCYEIKHAGHLVRSKKWRAKWFGCVLIAAVYHLWMERNRRIFADESRSLECILRLVKSDVSIRMLHNLGEDESVIVNALNGI